MLQCEARSLVFGLERDELIPYHQIPLITTFTTSCLDQHIFRSSQLSTPNPPQDHDTTRSAVAVATRRKRRHRCRFVQNHEAEPTKSAVWAHACCPGCIFRTRGSSWTSTSTRWAMTRPCSGHLRQRIDLRNGPSSAAITGSGSRSDHLYR